MQGVGAGAQLRPDRRLQPPLAAGHSLSTEPWKLLRGINEAVPASGPQQTCNLAWACAAWIPHLCVRLLALCILLMKSMDVISIKDNYIFKVNITFCTKTKLHEISVCSRAARRHVRRAGEGNADPFRTYILLHDASLSSEVKSNLFSHTTFQGGSSCWVLLGRFCSHAAIMVTVWKCAVVSAGKDL